MASLDPDGVADQSGLTVLALGADREEHVWERMSQEPGQEAETAVGAAAVAHPIGEQTHDPKDNKGKSVPLSSSIQAEDLDARGPFRREAEDGSRQSAPTDSLTSFTAHPAISGHSGHSGPEDPSTPSGSSSVISATSPFSGDAPLPMPAPPPPDSASQIPPVEARPPLRRSSPPLPPLPPAATPPMTTVLPRLTSPPLASPDAVRRPRAVSEWMPATTQQLQMGASAPPPPPPPPPLPPLRNRRQDSVLPRWQPDPEVTYCPICRTQFSIFVRKHHCRKCGRVVCNSCSPHRIIIPYQYIVQPPGQYAFRTASVAANLLGDTVDGTGGGYNSSTRSSSSTAAEQGQFMDVSTLGGGERVRLCNPCVPDPNTTPPRAATIHASGLLSPRSALVGRLPDAAAGMPSSVVSASSASTASHQSQHRQNYGYQPPRPHRLSLPPQPSAIGAGVASSSAFGSSEGAGAAQIQLAAQLFRNEGSEAARWDYPHEYSGRPSYPHRSHRHHHHQPLPPPPPPGPFLAEEDECPVCHRELPSRLLSNFEQKREQHIMRCLESHSVGGGSSSSRSRSHSNTNSGHGLSGQTAPAGFSDHGNITDEENSNLTNDDDFLPPMPSLHWRTGMFPYLATEKDCVDAAECTICLEEFEVGVPMARLECLCRFHRACIRAWFEKHPGRCPVHNHDGTDY